MVDADIGQSDIGPPATVAMGGVVSAPVSSLSDISPVCLRFVGASSPELVLTETVAAVRAGVDAAVASGADLIVIDTTGLVQGWVGRVVKRARIDVC